MILKNKCRGRRLTLPKFKTDSKPNNQDTVVLAKGEIHRSMKQKSRNKPTHK